MTHSNSPSILIVDDEAAVLFSHAAILERLGYSISTADSATRAFEFLERQRFDLLICDLSLGDGSGLDVIAAALRQDSHIRIILMTGYADTVLPQELAGAGITIVSKPANIPDLLHTIKRLLECGSCPDQNQAAD